MPDDEYGTQAPVAPGTTWAAATAYQLRIETAAVGALVAIFGVLTAAIIADQNAGQPFARNVVLVVLALGGAVEPVNRPTVGIVSLVLRCAPVGGRLSSGDEALSVHWRTIQEIRQRLDPVYAIRVTQAVQCP